MTRREFAVAVTGMGARVPGGSNTESAMRSVYAGRGLAVAGKIGKSSELALYGAVEDGSLLVPGATPEPKQS